MVADRGGVTQVNYWPSKVEHVGEEQQPQYGRTEYSHERVSGERVQEDLFVGDDFKQAGDRIRSMDQGRCGAGPENCMHAPLARALHVCNNSACLPWLCLPATALLACPSTRMSSLTSPHRVQPRAADVPVVWVLVLLLVYAQCVFAMPSL
jgi:hypothetical protein